jgi:transcription elongation factor Elf1
MTKPRDELGKILRKRLHCPVCSPTGLLAAVMAPDESDGKPLRVVAYRKSSVRLACRTCGLRFSIDVKNFADVVAERGRPPDGEIEAAARKLSKDNPADYLAVLAHCRTRADDYVRDQRNEILQHHQAGVAADRPRRGRINFPKRSKTPIESGGK